MVKRRRKKKIKFKSLLLLILILFSIFFGITKIKNILLDYKLEQQKIERVRIKKEKQRKEQEKWKQVFKDTDPEFDTIKEDENINYSGAGQEKVHDNDMYFTTFTTIEEHKKTYIEYKQNGPTPWADNPYWGETMETSGCGITMLSILLSGYGYDLTPEDLREKYYPNLDYSKLNTELKNSYSIDATPFYFSSMYYSKDKILSHLYTNRPVIVCVWNQLENRWTTRSHFILLLAATDDNKVYVSNPNGLMNSSRSSGWYSLDEITPYIAKIMYVNSF